MYVNNKSSGQKNWPQVINTATVSQQDIGSCLECAFISTNTYFIYIWLFCCKFAIMFSCIFRDVIQFITSSFEFELI